MPHPGLWEERVQVARADISRVCGGGGGRAKSVGGMTPSSPDEASEAVEGSVIFVSAGAVDRSVCGGFGAGIVAVTGVAFMIAALSRRFGGVSVACNAGEVSSASTTVLGSKRGVGWAC